MALEVGSAVLRTATPSLVKLLKYEWGLDKRVKQGLTSLEAELRIMQAFLEDVSNMPPDQLPRQVKLWADEVRELRYAIERRLHSFVARMESTKGTFLSAASKLNINNEIDSYIKETRIKIKEVRERYGPYPSKSSLVSSSVRTVDPRIFATHSKESDLVGIAGATVELTKMLSKSDHVSIVGMGGLGKTTLARAVFDKMKGGFDYRAFVPVGRSSDAKKVLKDIFYELRIEIYGDAPDERQLMEQLQNSLVDKSVESKIITTTRKLEVAEKVGGVYKIKPLSPANSLALLNTKIFGSEAKTDDNELSRVSDKLLSKCGGVPIAIITTASLLAKKHRNEWSKVYDNIGFVEHEKEDVVKDIRMILSFSYYDLPYHLQRCFLYLSLFPEDHWIEKNMLIWRWVAEGLVVPCCNEQGLGLFELGKRYFDELIDKNLIQLAVSPRDIGQGGCRIHDMMLDLIRNLSSRENFSTVLGRKQECTSATSTIQRLAIHKTSVDEIQSTSMEMGEVLSFYANTCPGSSLPQLSRFAWLRVIDLEHCDLSLGNYNLEHLEKLEEVAYVGLSGTPVTKLPKKIGRHNALQTFDVTAIGIRELPPFVGELTNLRCLRAGKGARMVDRVGKLASLEELWLHSVDKSPDFAAELRKLTELRVLVIHFDEMDVGLKEVLVESLSSLRKLQILQVWSDQEEMIRLGSWEGNVPSPNLHQLLLFRVSLPRLASWIHCSYVPKLSKLLLQVEVLKVQDLEILGQIPSLRSLYLHCEKYTSLSYTASKDEFKVLEYLNTNIEQVCGEGALPVIQELDIGGIRVGTDVGLQGNMPLLERATYHLDCNRSGLVEIDKAEAALRQASQAHPNRPTLSIKRFNNFNAMLQMMCMEDRLTESVYKDIVSGLGGLNEAQSIANAIQWLSSLAYSPAIGNIVKELERVMPTFKAPPTLTVGDTTDSAGSSSQFAGAVPPRRPNGEGAVLVTTSSTAALSTITSEDYRAIFKSIIAATPVRMDPDELMNTLEDSDNIALLNSMKYWEADETELVSQGEKMVGEPGRDSETSARATEELSNNSLGIDFESVLDRAESMFVDSAMFSSINRVGVFGITPKDLIRKLCKKSLKKPEFVAYMKSLQNVGGSGPSASDIMSKLLKLLTEDFVSNLGKKTDAPERGQGAEANSAGKQPAENSGASVSREPTPKVPCMHTPVDSALPRWLNSPDGANITSKLVDSLRRNPEMIASISRGIQKGKGNFPGNPTLDSFIDALASSSNATVPQGAATATESSLRDGENFSRMFNLKELLPAVELALAAGGSSGQPSSKPDNVGIKERGGE